MIDYSWTFVHPAYADDVDGVKPRVAVSELFDVLDRARAASDRLAAAAVGDRVEVPLEPEELDVHLSNVESRLQQDPFPNSPSRIRRMCCSASTPLASCERP